MIKVQGTSKRAPKPFAAEVRERAVRLVTDERGRLQALERENRELKRANQILRKASAFLAAAELDRYTK